MKYLETAFDDFVIKAVEEKLPSLTLDLATAYPYRLGASSIIRLQKDSRDCRICRYVALKRWRDRQKEEVLL